MSDAISARKVDVRLPGKGDSNSHGAGPVHLIIMIKWIRTSRLSIKNSLSTMLVLTYHVWQVAKYAEPIKLVLRVASNVSTGIEGGIIGVSGAPPSLPSPSNLTN